MRLTKEQRESAKEELLSILLYKPKTTGELAGTPKFHGERTLSLWQIKTLLRETGKVTEKSCGQGMFTSTLWKLKPEFREEIKHTELLHYDHHLKCGDHLHDMKDWKERLLSLE